MSQQSAPTEIKKTDNGSLLLGTGLVVASRPFIFIYLIAQLRSKVKPAGDNSEYTKEKGI